MTMGALRASVLAVLALAVASCSAQGPAGAPATPPLNMSAPYAVCAINTSTSPVHFDVAYLVPSKNVMKILWAFKPAAGQTAMTGNCQYVLDSDCNIVATSPCNVKTNNSCTRLACSWPGNPASCPKADPSCVFLPPTCSELPKAEGAKCAFTVPIPDFLGIDLSCTLSGGTCSGDGLCIPNTRPDGTNCAGYKCNPLDECCPQCDSGQCINVGHGEGLCCETCTGKKCPPPYLGTGGACYDYYGGFYCACTHAGFCEYTTSQCFG